MFLIVLHHAAFHGLWKDDTSLILLPFLFTTLLNWHVDGFIGISGWFGVRFSTRRFFRLFGVMLFYSLIRIFYNYHVLHLPLYNAVGVFGGWFGNTYLAFMFIAPLLNVALERIVSLPRRHAFLIWAVFDVGMILNWAPYNAFSGVLAAGGSAFSILTFVSVYVNVRLVRLFGLDEKFNYRIFGCCVAIFLVGTLLFSVSWAAYQILAKGSASQYTWIGHTSYNSPHCIIMALAILLLFVKCIKIPRRIGLLSQHLAPLMFGVYMIHHTTGIGELLYILPQKALLEHTRFPAVPIVFMSALFCFSACAAIDYIRHKAASPITRFLHPHLEKLDLHLGFA